MIISMFQSFLFSGCKQGFKIAVRRLASFLSVGRFNPQALQYAEVPVGKTPHYSYEYVHKFEVGVLLGPKRVLQIKKC